MPPPGAPSQEAVIVSSQAPEGSAHSPSADDAKTHGPLKELQNTATGKHREECTILASGLVIVISTSVLPQAALDGFFITICPILNIKPPKSFKLMPAQKPYICRVACHLDLRF